MSQKLKAGELVPDISLSSLNGEIIFLGEMNVNIDWQMVVVYRGKHCPLCTKYLAKLKTMSEDFKALAMEVVVVSADPESRAKEHVINELDLPYKVGIDLSVSQMEKLGVYISDPRSAQETDRPFAEPGIFVIRKDKKLQIIDISNAPFMRPDLDVLLHGLKFIKERDYPIRGTHT